MDNIEKLRKRLSNAWKDGAVEFLTLAEQMFEEAKGNAVETADVAVAVDIVYELSLDEDDYNDVTELKNNYICLDA